MGLIRGALVVFVCILLFIIFLVGIILLTLTSSLKYENIKDQVAPLVKDTIKDQVDIDITEEIEKELAAMEINCEDYPEEYVFSEQGYTITLSCETLIQGTDAVIEEGIDSLIETAYYKEYTCDFWKCFDEEEIPLFLVSEKAHDYWRSKFYLALTIAIVLMVALFFLFRRKPNTFIVPGIMLIVASLPFMKANSLMSISGDSIVVTFFGIFFSKAHDVFVTTLIVGIVLFLAGLIFRLFIIGFKFSKFFKREESKGVKERKSDKSKKK